jgi:hypothetical protein
MTRTICEKGHIKVSCILGRKKDIVSFSSWQELGATVTATATHIWLLFLILGL